LAAQTHPKIVLYGEDVVKSVQELFVGRRASFAGISLGDEVLAHLAREHGVEFVILPAPL